MYKEYEVKINMVQEQHSLDPPLHPPTPPSPPHPPTPPFPNGGKKILISSSGKTRGGESEKLKKGGGSLAQG